MFLWIFYVYGIWNFHEKRASDDWPLILIDADSII
jgi:hypothetical protein